MKFPLSKKLGAAAIATLSLMFAGYSAKAQTSGVTSDGFHWHQIEGGVEIDYYTGAGGAVTVPNGINGQPVITLWSFSDHNEITSISIPDTVTTFDINEFQNCSNLKNVSLPSGMTIIPSGMFYGCTSLNNIKIPNKVYIIDDNTFTGCASLTSISLPNGVVRIGAAAFEGCTSLTTVTIPSSVTQFSSQLNTSYSHAFHNCTSLANVCFLGNKPLDGGNIFDGDPVAVLYYINGKEGWSVNGTFSGKTTMPCFECGDPIKFAPEATGSVDGPINLNSSGAPNLVLVIHGYTPPTKTPYSDAADMPALAAAIGERLQADGVANQWDVRFFDWSSDSGTSPAWAAANGQLIGRRTGQQILADGKYKKIQLISWSAGTWLADSIASTVANKNGITTSTTFLDAFIPDEFQQLFGLSPSGNYPPSALGSKISDAEQYYETAFGWGTGFNVSAVNYNITPLIKNPAKNENGCFSFTALEHSFPPFWYTYTVRNSSYGFGFQNRFNITGGGGILDCGNAGPLPQQQLQAQSLSRSLSTAASSTPVDDSGAEWLMMKLHEAEAEAEANSLVDTSSDTGDSSKLPLTLSPNAAFISQPMDSENAPTSPPPSFLILGSAASLTNLNLVATGGTGAISNNSTGVEFDASSFLWGSFNINTTNDINWGTIEYSNSGPNASVVTLWIDGQLVQAIESDTNSPLIKSEVFPLSTALDSGAHVVTIGLQSLNNAPVSSTIKKVGLYYVVNQLSITSQTIDTNNNFNFTWEAAAGLKYQPQYINDLTSSQWLNLGGLLSSPTNAMMSAFDNIYTNQQRFYRVGIQE